MKTRLCQSCGMPLTRQQDAGTNQDGSMNPDYCRFCYQNGAFTRQYTMDEMIEHCAQMVDAYNKDAKLKLTREEAIARMKVSFPKLKRWKEALTLSDKNPATEDLKAKIAALADKLPFTYISSVDDEGFPCTKAMLSPRLREGVQVFYFTTNTSSLRVAQFQANAKASIYFCDEDGFQGMMLRGYMEVLQDEASKAMIWKEGDTQYYPEGVTDPNYCVLRFTATDGRYYCDFRSQSFLF